MYNTDTGEYTETFTVLTDDISFITNFSNGEKQTSFRNGTNKFERNDGSVEYQYSGTDQITYDSSDDIITAVIQGLEYTYQKETGLWTR